MKVIYEATQLRHGILVVRKPDMKFVGPYQTMQEAEAKAAELNSWPAPPDVGSGFQWVSPDDLEPRLMGILDRIHGPDELWVEAA